MSESESILSNEVLSHGDEKPEEAEARGLTKAVKRAYILANSGGLGLDSSLTESYCDEWTLKVLDLESLMDDIDVEDLTSKISVIRLKLEEAKKKQQAAVGTSVAPVTVPTPATATMTLLEKYNIEPWLMSLKSDLTDMGVLRAITVPLSVDDVMNIKACARIYNSVPEELRKPIRGVKVAYEMVDQLKKKFEKPSYVQQEAIKEELSELKLTSYDAESVAKHVDTLEKKLEHLSSSGVPVTEKMKCTYLANSLPMPIDRSTTSDWKVIRETIRFSSGNFEAAVLDVKVHAKWLVEGGITAFVEAPSSSFMARGHRGYRGGFNRRNFGRGGNNFSSGSVNPPKCFLCNGGHYLQDCPLKAEFEKFKATNKGDSAQYSDRTFFTSEPHFLDSGASSHHQRNRRRFRTLRKSSASVLTANLYQLDDLPDDVAMRTSTKDWHAALGHPCEKKMKELQRKFPHLHMTHPDFCESCVLAKQRQQPYPLREDQYDGPLELLHMDLLDAKGRGYEGSFYALVIVDDFSKYCEVVLLKNKSADSVLAGFEQVKVRLEKSTGCSVKRRRKAQLKRVKRKRTKLKRAE
ncbi:hypothetical protein TYRP_014480 [Tyrophagus putrescentiae]|nr:hypothetical protein TYRP_014480 [Tyrophagus putrescentiae]